MRAAAGMRTGYGRCSSPGRRASMHMCGSRTVLSTCARGRPRSAADWPAAAWTADVRATAQVARTLLYVTTMSQARLRVARGLAAFHALTDCLRQEPCHPHAERCHPRTEHGPMRVEPGEMRAGPGRLRAEPGHLRW